MTLEPSMLLKLLGLTARPTVQGAAVEPVPGIEQRSFASLLDEAETGKLRTGREVVLGPDAEFELTEAQLRRLAKAADQAEASGIRQALVLLDGRAVVLDVPSRSVEAEVDLSRGPLRGVDGVIDLRTGGDAAAVRPPGVTPSNPSLVRLLAERSGAQQFRTPA